MIVCQLVTLNQHDRISFSPPSGHVEVILPAFYLILIVL